MENFFYDDKFYSDLGELMEDIDLFEKDDVLKLPDDYSLDCKGSKLEPIITLSPEWISERIDDERFSEDGDEIEKVEKALLASVDFEKVNSLLPKLYYVSREKVIITKADMLDWVE